MYKEKSLKILFQILYLPIFNLPMDNFHKINFEVSFKKGYVHPNLLNVQMILKNYFNRAFLIDVLTINFP